MNSLLGWKGLWAKVYKYIKIVSVREVIKKVQRRKVVTRLRSYLEKKNEYFLENKNLRFELWVGSERSKA